MGIWRGLLGHSLTGEMTPRKGSLWWIRRRVRDGRAETVLMTRAQPRLDVMARSVAAAIALTWTTANTMDHSQHCNWRPMQ